MASWNQLDRPLLLASTSPRRKELLGKMGFRFEVVPPRISDERALIDEADLLTSVRMLAYRKADSVAERHPEALVLGSDTVVVVDQAVLGKPSDEAEGRQMLQQLSGRSHRVVSGVSLVCREAGFSSKATAVTTVRFRTLPDREIDEYLTHAHYRDKAGAYGIQDAAMVFVEAIDGCYYNVVGLPIATTINLFESYLTH